MWKEQNGVNTFRLHCIYCCTHHKKPVSSEGDVLYPTLHCFVFYSIMFQVYFGAIKESKVTEFAYLTIIYYGNADNFFNRKYRIKVGTYCDIIHNISINTIIVGTGLNIFMDTQKALLIFPVLCYNRARKHSSFLW